MTQAPATKRLFYRDPLAAAWQAKHHGMRFVDGCTEGEIEPELIGSALYSIGYVHPDGLPLLEMKPGDYAIDTYGVVRHVERITDGGRAIGGSSALFSESDKCSIYQPRIIQRDGKPFHWPECEV